MILNNTLLYFIVASISIKNDHVVILVGASIYYILHTASQWRNK